MKTVAELAQHIGQYIVGSFGEADMQVLRDEVEKLKPNDIYLEIGVDEGKSLTTANYYAKDGVWCVGVDYIDSPNRSPYMNIPSGENGPNPQGQGLIHLGGKVVYIQGDAKMVCKLWTKPISLMFIDGDHSYEGVRDDTLSWEGKMKKGGVILYHDYDSPPVKVWLDEHYGDKKEIFNGKIVKVIV